MPATSKTPTAISQAATPGHARFQGSGIGGGAEASLFQSRPDKVFVAWVYPEGSNKKLILRKLEAGDFSEEDIRRINVRYKKLIADKAHAM